MHNVVFLTTHLHSGIFDLCEVLNSNLRIQIKNSGTVYKHPEDLDSLCINHKLSNSAAVYGDILFYNAGFACKPLFKCCKFIYLIKPANAVLNDLVRHNKYTPLTALRYYTFRLRRICEMAINTPGAVLTTFEEAMSGKSLPLIEEYLNLNEPLKPKNNKIIETENKIPLEINKKGEESFEKHLYYLRNLPLKSLK